MKTITRLGLTLLMALALAGPAFAQLGPPESTAAPSPFPRVSFGVVSFLQYAAELHESDGYNAFDITRGYFNVRAQLNDRVQSR